MISAYGHSGHAAELTLEWAPPATRTDGSPLSEVASYAVHFGTGSGQYSRSINAIPTHTVSITNLDAGATYYFAVTAYDAAGRQSAFSEEITWTIPYLEAPDPPSSGGDGEGFDSARRTVSVYDPITGRWYVRDVNGHIVLWAAQWGGFPGAVPVSGDYTGDGHNDLAVYDSNSGRWYVRDVNGQIIVWAAQWGYSGAVPVSGDYSGDGRSDLVIYDSNSGRWYVRDVNGQIIVWAEQWGYSGAVPVSGDYTGDGRHDLAVYDSSSGRWYVRDVNGQIVLWGAQWGGFSSAMPVPGDYTGDGHNDLAVYDLNTGRWYVRDIQGAVVLWASQWGFPGAMPVGL